jgi:ribosomal subunit interface protein
MTMQFTVTGKQMDVGESLRRHIESNVNASVGKYFGSGIEAHAVLHREAHLFCCDLSVHVGRGILVQAREKDTDPYLAADRAAECVAKRMARYKGRLKDHHQNGAGRKGVEAFQASYAILAAEPEEAEAESEGIDPESGRPVVIAEMTKEIPTLTVSEAVMRLDLALCPVIMFRNSGHGALNVVYRRDDGNIGWIDPGRDGASTRPA